MVTERPFVGLPRTRCLTELNALGAARLPRRLRVREAAYRARSAMSARMSLIIKGLSCSGVCVESA